MKRLFCLAIVVAIATVSMTACSKGTSVPGGGGEASPSEALQNTTHFPLYADSVVIVSKGFSKTVQPGQNATGYLSSGAGTYVGNEVVASSNASLGELEKWVHGAEAKPPSGFVAVAMPAKMMTIHDVAMKNGMCFAVFKDASNPKHGLVVVAFDPQIADKKLGPALLAVSKYQNLPAPMKQAIDTQLRQRFGYGASDFVEAGSPIGSAAAALAQFKSQNQRGIVVVEATKQ